MGNRMSGYVCATTKLLQRGEPRSVIKLRLFGLPEGTFSTRTDTTNPSKTWEADQHRLAASVDIEQDTRPLGQGHILPHASSTSPAAAYATRRCKFETRIGLGF